MTSQWGVELWDCSTAVLQKYDDDSTLLEQCREFVKVQSKIEAQYVKDMKANIESTRKAFKVFEEKDSFKEMTTLKAWGLAVKESEDMMKQHESVADAMLKDVCDPVKVLLKTRKSEADRLAKDLAKLHKELDKNEQIHQAKKKKSESEAKAAADTEGKLATANKGKAPQKAKIQKLEDEVKAAQAKAETAKNELTIAVANVQEARTKHHMDSMKSFMNDVQKQQTQLVENNGLFLSKFALLHRDIQPHMNSCVQGLEGAADMVDAGADVEAFKTLTKTGSLPEQAIRPAGDVTVQQIHQKRVSKNKIFKTTSRKKDAIRDDFGHLPPEQRKRALKSKLSELNVTLAKEAKAQQGLEKTIEAYTKNPQMGDEKSKKKMVTELEEVNKTMTKLNHNLEKFELYLSAIEGTAVPPTRRAPPASVPASASAPTPRAAAPDPDSSSGEEEDFEDDVDDAPETSSATCLYAFEGSNDGELPCTVGETVSVTEPDNEGTGWIRVVNATGGEGYVPTAYMQCS